MAVTVTIQVVATKVVGAAVVVLVIMVGAGGWAFSRWFGAETAWTPRTAPRCPWHAFATFGGSVP